MTPHQAYHRSSQSGWTRIEMLLAIYDETITAIEGGLEILNQDRMADYPAQQLRASQLCLLLISGIDPGGSDVSRQIYSLCLFCLNQISQPVAGNWTHARDLLMTLRSGFQEIREQGIQMENEGTIARLSSAPAQTLLHV